jgi:hypothetical protein
VLEQERAVLKQRLAALASGSETDAASSKAKSPDPLAKENAPIDWKKIAAQVVETHQTRGGGDMRTYIRTQQKISAMSKEELVSALDEIAALDLPDESRQTLQQLLLTPLCEKNPEYALTRYFDRVDDHDRMKLSHFTAAMTGWSGKNPTAAAAWLDQQIAAGKLDSKSLDGTSRARIQFEGALIGALISSDPAAAALRLKSLPEDQRSDSLRTSRKFTEDKDQLAYANLVRSGLSEAAQAQQFTEKASMIASTGGYTKITEYLDRIKATPAERAGCVEKAVDANIQYLSKKKKVTREDIDAMREWATSQAPGTTANVTGVALARSTRTNNQLEFSEAAALATQYHEADGNDEVLIGFLMAYDPRNGSKEEAQVLAQKISDVKKREEIFNRFK